MHTFNLMFKRSLSPFFWEPTFLRLKLGKLAPPEIFFKHNVVVFCVARNYAFYKINEITHTRGCWVWQFMLFGWLFRTQQSSVCLADDSRKKTIGHGQKPENSRTKSWNRVNNLKTCIKPKIETSSFG